MNKGKRFRSKIMSFIHKFTKIIKLLSKNQIYCNKLGKKLY